MIAELVQDRNQFDVANIGVRATFSRRPRSRSREEREEAMTAAFSIAYGHEAEHAEALKRGLAALPHGFLAEICGLCDGHGSRPQRFNAGCGQGYYTMTSGCDYCDGTGLQQGYKPAPASVLAQVLTAAGLKAAAALAEDHK